MLIAFENVGRDIFKYPHRAIVVWNTDPLGLGRVKVIVPGLLEGVVENLPWVYRQNAPGMGTETQPPLLESEVLVEYKFGDIYHGFYTEALASVANTSGETRGMGTAKTIQDDKLGNREVRNAATGEKRIEHQSGSSVVFDGAGNITIEAANNLTLRSKSGVSIVFNSETGEIERQEPGKTDQGGKTPSVVGRSYKLQVDSYEMDSSGGYTAFIQGGYKLSAQNYSQSIIGNYATVVGGQSSFLFSQLSNVTYGLGMTCNVVLGAYTVNLLGPGAYTVNAPLGAVSFTGLTIALTGSTSIALTAPLVLLGAGLAPMVSILSDPLEDLITGKPKLGVPTILGG